MTLKKLRSTKPTGDLMSSENKLPITTPVPLPVAFCDIEGAYTAFDRKLWVLLLHLEWDNLLTKSKVGEWHEVKESDLRRVIENYVGSMDIERLWQSARRLTRTTVEYRFTENDVRWRGISSLFSAQVLEKGERDGFFRFKFPSELVPMILEPARFARLRLQFMLKLKSKYAVTLYEILEGVANRNVPIVEATVDELRSWLKIPNKKLSLWDHLSNKALKPALKEINENPELSGMKVDCHLIRFGKGGKVQRVKFIVTKTEERKIFESQLKFLKSPTITLEPSKSYPKLLPQPTEALPQKTQTESLTEPISAEVEEILNYFVATFPDSASDHRSTKVVYTIKQFLKEHGVERTRFFVNYAKFKANNSNYKVATFNGILKFLPEALKAYEDKQAKIEAENNQRRNNALERHQKDYEKCYFDYIDNECLKLRTLYVQEFEKFDKKVALEREALKQMFLKGGRTLKDKAFYIDGALRDFDSQLKRVYRTVEYFSDHLPDFWTWDEKINTEGFGK
jgi:hypothetical protein